MDGVTFSILMVDDDEDDRIIIDEAFMQIGYGAEIKKFVSGEGLFRYLSQVDPKLYPSLIVLDYHVRQWEASDLLKMLKDNPSYASIPVVIYTGSLAPSEAAELKRQGAFACIEKGALMSEIVSIAEQLRDLAEANKINRASTPEA
jgi:DNA-binding NtrC family response regulator